MGSLLGGPSFGRLRYDTSDPGPPRSSRTATRTLIFGGTFDPVHHGHLITAQAAAEALGAESVVFVPAHISPHKGPGTASAAPAAGPHRAAMLAAAIAGMPGWRVDPLELQRMPPSYTFDTVADLQAREPQTDFVLLMGADQLAALHTWHRVSELLARVQIAVLQRPGADVEPGLAAVKSRLGAAAEAQVRAALLSTPLIDISATRIRARVRAGLSVRYLVPEAVAEYIARERLYRA